MTHTDRLIREINYFIGLDGFQQHNYCSEACNGNSYFSSVFWSYLRNETLNRRIVQDGYS